MKTDLTFYNGNTIPAVGFGTFRIEDNDAAAEVVERAIKAGYRQIDTASIYGNEEGVGRGIKNSGVPREEVFLTTKIWNGDLRDNRVKEAFEESLARLGTDYIDLLLVHWPTGEYTKYWKDFEDLYESGKVKNIGVSNFTMRMLDELLAVAKVKPVVNQIELHPQLTQKPLLKYCDKKEIAITAWSGFGVGALLTNPTLVKMAKKYGKTPAQIILRWNYQYSILTIPKSTNTGRMAENLDIFDFKIEFNDLKKIDAINKNERLGPNPENFNF